MIVEFFDARKDAAAACKLFEQGSALEVRLRREHNSKWQVARGDRCHKVSIAEPVDTSLEPSDLRRRGSQEAAVSRGGQSTRLVDRNVKGAKCHR